MTSNNNNNLQNRRYLLIVTGEKQSGKDTTADHLVLNYGAQKISIGEKLKIVTHDILEGLCSVSVPLPYFSDPSKKEMVLGEETQGLMVLGKPLTIRRAVQFVGIDVIMKYLGNDVWCDVAIKDVIESESRVVVIPDICFLNEYNKIIEKCGYRFTEIHTLSIKRSHVVRSEEHKHPTDTEVKKIPFTMEYFNDGTKEDLISFVDSMCKQLSI